MPDLQALLDRIEKRSHQALGDEPHPHLDGPLHAQWIDHQRQCAEDSQQDAQKLLAALRAVVKECDRLKRVANNTVHEDSPARHIIRANGVRQAADQVLEVLQDALGADQ
jgi:hypothetical protein